jgi:outer membrane protein TolC
MYKKNISLGGIIFSIAVQFGLNFIYPVPARAENPVNVAANQDQTVNVLHVVQKTIEHQPAIHMLREQISLVRGLYRRSGGEFDWRIETFFLHQRDYAPISTGDPTIESSETNVAGLKFSKLLRTGVSVEPFLQYTENSYHILNDDKTSPSKTGHIGLLFTVPLMRGIGYENTAVAEIAAGHALKAAQMELSHGISDSVYNAVQSFWAYVAANKQLAILLESVERARIILQKTEILMQADELPTAELVNVRANLANKESSAVAAEQAVVEAKINLGMAMGIPTAEIFDLPPPDDHFPDLESISLHHVMDIDHTTYAAIATHNRQDFLAAGEQNKSLKAQLKAAKDRVKPTLNLELSLGYDGLETGSSLEQSWRSLEFHQDTPDWSTGLRLIYPLGNNSNNGALEQALASLHQGVLQEQELLRSIQTKVRLARSDLFSLLREFKRSNEALDNYSTTVANEHEKFLMGETALLDLLYIENLRDNARLNHITICQRAANSLARLRFETGQLVHFVDDEGIVTLNDLTTILVPDETDTP